ncbi:hypothetical protein EYR41_010313 [Orbilia oligospora]|uniref:Uncharacterized protein n=1 Tax=Orbilia oligospora TaxID=2813651 RepID=A0A8H2DMG7_ORBOL|nr:hypothetical protein EYR41_010313 [Orbilia oligospora]
MSENIPESIPTSMDPQSHRPNKKRALSPSSAQAAQLASLMKNPDRFVPTAKSREKKLAPPPEIVANVQGSSAGAGSERRGRKKKLAQEKKKESERTGTPQFESADNEADDAGADGAAGPTDNEVGPQIKLVKNIQASNGTSAAVAPSSGNRSIVIFDDD